MCFLNIFAPKLFFVLKTTISIVLLFVITLATLFPFAYLKMEKKAIRKSIKHKIIAGIDKNELVLLVFDKHEVDKKVKWKHSKEFQYKGEMYDIVEKEIVGNEIYYWVWWDKEETKLNQKLVHLVRQNLAQNPNQNNKKQAITHFFKTLYLQNNQALNLLVSTKKQTHCTFYNNNFSFRQPSPPSPPPQIG